MATDPKPELVPWWRRALAVVSIAGAIIGAAWFAVKRDQADAAADPETDQDNQADPDGRTIDTTAEVK